VGDNSRSQGSLPPPADAAVGSGAGALGILVVAVGVRIVYFLQYAASPLMGDMQADQLYYFEWARRIAGGDWVGEGAFEQGPLYPYLTGALFAVVGEDPTLAYLGQMLLGCATCLLVWGTARRLFGNPTALAAGLVAATYGPFVFHECQFMKTFLAPLTTATALYATVRFRESHARGWLVLCGAAIGLACLEREIQGLLLLPAAWCGPWTGRPGIGRLRRAADAAILVGAWALCLVPSAVRNARVAGEFVLVTAGGGEVFYIAHGPQATAYYTPPGFLPAHVGLEHRAFREEAARRTGRPMSSGESSRFWFREGLRQIAADPVAAARRSVVRLLVLFDDFEAPDSEDYDATARFVPVLRWLPHFGWISAWGGLGTLACLAIPELRRGRTVVAFAAVHVAAVAITYNFGRFRMGLVVPWLILAAVAWTAILVRLRAREPRGRRAAVAAVVAGIGLTCLVAVRWQPVAFDVARSTTVARLALRSGDLTLAAAESRAILDRFGDVPLAAAPAQQVSVVAQARTVLGEAALRSGATEAAGSEFRTVLSLPLPPSLREGFLRQFVDLLQERIAELGRAGRGSGSAEAGRAVRRTRAEFARELARLAPEQPAFWALAAAGAEDDADRGEIAAGLAAAWQGLAEPTPQDRAWYAAGRAFLAAGAGRAAEARQAARDALSAWPEHPLRDELPE
jgi:hypothetical protein